MVGTRTDGVGRDSNPTRPDTQAEAAWGGFLMWDSYTTMTVTNLGRAAAAGAAGGRAWARGMHDWSWFSGRMQGVWELSTWS